MVVIKIRGIYTTALVLLLKDHGFKVSQPSKAVLSRFDNSCITNEPSQATIIDRRDKQGIIVKGEEQVVKKVVDVIKSKIPESIVRVSKINPHSIFKGVVVKKEGDRCLVDLGFGLGTLFNGSIKLNEEVLVAVARPVFRDERPILTRKLKISGRYAHIILGGWVSVSKFIRNRAKQEELFTLGKMVKSPRWGVKWRSSAENASATDLISEVKSLIEMGDKLLEKAKNIKPPALLLKGEPLVDIEFPQPAKNRLDRLRGYVKPTITGHHYLRSCGKTMSTIVDFAEALLSLGVSESTIQKALSLMWDENLLYKGSILKIEHSTLNGDVYSLTPGVIREINCGIVEVKREFRGEGKFDGLEIPKSKGDYSIMIFKPGDWMTLNAYYSINGELKGIYVNVNTPIEVYKSKIRYVDLGIDVVKRANSTPEIIDVDVIERAHVEGKLSSTIYEKALDVANSAYKALLASNDLEDLKSQLFSTTS
ncbi:MAG: hypothetical protein DRJ31_00115 [Candidatus Methanomethylicota archaeon]|uniref:Probable ribonuclease FAU-1 n=1 Tax=Thermoproteota archaeon TaxID=2056631 RepID=A0A497F321_9CREN|nr:MAG: hypothetical protein DRJ31_00115 [Candidatus Verstraetearchaeota archaeon]RLE53622.1 MAG: hypothetical protein DRJ33_00500 [Candidatus Verstraetearchaeota archaeon]